MMAVVDGPLNPALSLGEREPIIAAPGDAIRL